MKRTAKLVLPAFISISLAGLVVLVVFYYRTRGAHEVTFTEDRDVGVKIENLEYANTSKGRTVWRLRAGEATRFKTRQLMALKEIELVFYSDNKSTFTMKARKGRFNEAKKVIFASGDVVVTSTEGYTLRTRRLRYDTGAGLITSGDPVVIQSGDMVVKGVGFKVDVESGSMEIMRDVHAVLNGGEIDG
jgi:LPS export ABC transporter protein LptC